MKFKNRVFLNEKFMQTVAKCNEYEDWEPKGAYWFNRLVKKLQSGQEDFNDTKNKLVKKYGDEPDKDGNVKVAEVHFINSFPYIFSNCSNTTSGSTMIFLGSCGSNFSLSHSSHSDHHLLMFLFCL